MNTNPLYNSELWREEKAKIAAIPDPNPTAPVGDCPRCGTQLMCYRGVRTNLFHCDHPGTDPGRCEFRFMKIAAEADLETMRATARAWIAERETEGRAG